jgi:hypothetical protein
MLGRNCGPLTNVFAASRTYPGLFKGVDWLPELNAVTRIAATQRRAANKARIKAAEAKRRRKQAARRGSAF